MIQLPRLQHGSAQSASNESSIFEMPKPAFRLHEDRQRSDSGSHRATSSAMNAK